MAREGTDVVALGIASVSYGISRTDDLEKTVAFIEDAGGRGIAVQADVRSQEQLDGAVQRGVSELGKVDILVANAGIISMAPFWETSEEMWQDMIDLNLTGV